MKFYSYSSKFKINNTNEFNLEPEWTLNLILFNLKIKSCMIYIGTSQNK
jgi:hypothetical protein